MKRKTIGFVALIVYILLVLTGCNRWVNPYNLESAEKMLNKHRKDIETVHAYICSTQYEFIYIETTDGAAYADFTDIEIQDADVEKAICRLLDKGEFLSISKSDNTITYNLWNGDFDIGAGLAYSINHIDLPDIAYVTELHPLTIDGWYYYVDDYNEWRIVHTDPQWEGP